MNIKQSQICIVGNMLGRHHGFVTSQGQIVGDLLAGEGFSVTCVSSRINRFLRLAEIVMTLLRGARRFDLVVVEVYSGPGLLVADVAGWLGKLLRLPLIMVLHGGHLPEFMERYPRWTKRVLDRAQALVAPSAFLAKMIGDAGYRVTQIANVIDIDQYPFRERAQIQPRLIWMRSFHSIYNPEMAIDVLTLLRKSFPNATLTMAGVDKGLERTTKKIAEDRGLAEAVRFPGFLTPDDKVREFARADVYLNTNRIDNMPVSVIEASAFGLPVVATRVGGLPYIIEDRENGRLVASDDPKAMAEAVVELLSDPDLTLRISQNARRLAEKSSWRRVRKDWEDLFARVLKPAAASASSVVAKENLSDAG